MNSIPLHPAVVHLPLGLAVIMPLIAAGFAWALWTGRLHVRAWIAVVALQAMLLGAGLVAQNTGLTEEERVEEVVPRASIHEHEESAEQFVWVVGATLVMAALVLVFKKPTANRVLLCASVAATLVVAGLGIRVGHAGGELVYVDGAASAYTSPRSAQPSGERSDTPRRGSAGGGEQGGSERGEAR